MLSAPRSSRANLLAGAGAVGLVLAALACSAPEAGAHAAFLESSPEPGTSLERPPRRVSLEFTEPLNRELTEIQVVSTASGDPVEAQTEFGGGGEVSVRPAGRIPRGSFRLDWYTVSTLDGHPLEGSFGFGVRAPAASGAQSIEQSPLARDGWLRIGARALMYAALFFFAGGVLGAALLSRGRHPAAWLFPDRLAAGTAPALDTEAIRGQAWARTRRVGWLATSMALAVALVETLDASGGLSAGDLNDFLLANGAGLARLATPVAVLVALPLATRFPVAAAGAVALALLSISFSGHANSAEPRSVAVLSDWTHLVGASVWLGGIAQVASVWVPLARRVEPPTRRAAMRAVLGRFGRVALPAFLVVVAGGLANALIELGRPEALWETGYGRVLGAKIVVVGFIALASYWHALRIRPRLLAANPRSPAGTERRHWRLLGSEPTLATAVVVAAATLVVFPLPPRQLSEAAESSAVPECDPCPVPEPQQRELAVAEAAGLRIAALWLDERGRGTLQILDRDARPADVPARLEGGELLDSCGPGCARVRVDPGTTRLTVMVEKSGHRQSAVVPVRWRPERRAQARHLLAKAQRTMRSLGAVRVRERTSSGPGFNNTVTAVLRAGPDKKIRQQMFRWSAFDSSARWLGPARVDGRRVVRVALLDSGSPTWYRVAIDPRSARVLTERLITQAHFISRRYSRFEESE